MSTYRRCRLSCAPAALFRREAIDIARQIAQGLEAAHEKGIVTPTGKTSR